MRKLIRGIIDFRSHVRPGYAEIFSRLALGQKPDTLLIACSDSRVAPNVFASSDPGDMFVIRNVGNIIPEARGNDVSGDNAEAAAIEFALNNLPVRDIVVCGHSECGAMFSLCQGREHVKPTYLREWLKHGDGALKELDAGVTLDPSLPKHNQLSQLNVLHQLEHIRSYKAVAERIKQGTLGLHGWFFDIAHAEVFAYDEKQKRFVVIDESYAEEMFFPSGS